jgi:hypothetical protein
VWTIFEVLLFVRIVAAATFVFLGPGLLLVARLGLAAEWPERLLLAFAISYSWVAALSVLLPLTHLTIVHAAVITLILCGAVSIWGGGLSPRTLWPAARHVFTAHAGVIALALILAVLGWTIEPPITGEEALDLASASRFADGGPITLDNTSVMPDTRSVYLFQPYQLAIAAVARLSATEPLVALVKLRAFLVPLCVLLLYAFARRLVPAPGEAPIVLAGILVFVAVDISTWEFNSLFPLVRRGGFSAGIDVPALMALFVLATRRSPPEVRVRRAAAAVMPPLLFASLTTHPLEMFPFLVFAGAVTLSALLRLDHDGSARVATSAMIPLVLTAAAYVAVQSHGVPLVAGWETPRKAALLSQLVAQVQNPVAFLTAPVNERAGAFLSIKIPSTTAGVVGPIGLALAAGASPLAAIWLSLAIVPLVAAFTVSGGYLALAWATSEATITDINSYFALLGACAVALASITVARFIMRVAGAFDRTRLTTAASIAFAAIAFFLIATMMLRAIPRLLTLAHAQPRLIVGLFGVSAVAAGTWAWVQRHRQVALASNRGVLLLAVLLVVPVATAGKSFVDGMIAPRDRLTLPAAFARARTIPSVMTWDGYFEYLQIAPPLRLPRSVVDTLKQQLPPRQVLLADPRYSCGLVVLVDAYCVNPETIYGYYFLSGERYLSDYAREKSAGEERPWHPFFNDTWPSDPSEGRIIRDFHVDYLLADPPHADLIDRKLRTLSPPAEVVARIDGFVLYRIVRD